MQSSHQVVIFPSPWWKPYQAQLGSITMPGTCMLRRVVELLDANGAWRMDLIRRYFLPADVDTIMCIRTLRTTPEDVLAWAIEKSGNFTVKYAYRLAMDEHERPSATSTSRAPDGRRTIWNTIWGCPALPKVRVFAWRVASKTLATWDNKFSRHLEVSNICPLCGMECEDTFQTFCRCPRSKELW